MNAFFKKSLLIALFVASVSSRASATVYEINKDHSHIQFNVDYMSLTKVEGQFKDYQGTFEFDTDKDILKKINVVINPNSVDTNEAKRDFHLKGHEFFFAANYPEIKFSEAGELKVALKEKVKLKGLLEIRGIKKEVIGDLKYKGKITDPWGKENLFFEFNLELDRKDFGMNWNKELDQGGYLVGDKVLINILVQAQKAGEKTAFSTHMVPSTKAIIERDQLKKGKIKKLSTSTDPKDHPVSKSEDKK